MQPKMTSSQFSEAVRNGKLMAIKCAECGEYSCPPRMVCQECGSPDGELVELSKKGIIRTFTCTNVAPNCFEAPYVVAIVETDEGPWIMGNITKVPLDQITEDLVGTRVDIGWREVKGDLYSNGDSVALDFVPAK